MIDELIKSGWWMEGRPQNETIQTKRHRGELWVSSRDVTWSLDWTDCPDLAPSDFHLFLKLKEFLGGKRFGSDEELENAVTTWLNKLAAEEYDMGILKIVDRYDKCLNVGGDYIEK
ncbi:hypothetical protein AVEN_17874-1 [Araneus ventricosus]|uniref:Uncharacterized protein n=1 Tax=Araneus ventricosus TaxID=182803 RepID=A0A4Y2J882_ARAVE|nr:hypothetical protein AVEN_17874-1 [Araneus ventricosus]